MPKAEGKSDWKWKRKHMDLNNEVGNPNKEKYFISHFWLDRSMIGTDFVVYIQIRMHMIAWLLAGCLPLITSLFSWHGFSGCA